MRKFLEVVLLTLQREESILTHGLCPDLMRLATAESISSTKISAADGDFKVSGLGRNRKKHMTRGKAQKEQSRRER